MLRLCAIVMVDKATNEVRRVTIKDGASVERKNRRGLQN